MEIVVQIDLNRVLRISVVALSGVATTSIVLSPPHLTAKAQEKITLGVYSARHYNTDKELYREFERQNPGISVKVLEAKDKVLLKRLQSEGDKSPADVLILVDAARLVKASTLGLFRPTSSATLKTLVPANLRNPQGKWYALTRRARVPIVNPDIVDPATIKSYADLANPALKGKLCLRNRKSPYNQSLVADQIILRGEAETAKWIRGMANNVSQEFFPKDTPQVQAVGKGKCGVAVVNTYYVGRMLAGRKGADNKALAEKVKVVFPNPTHVNVSGAGVTASSDNPEAALKLIEFLASPNAGKDYAAANLEYPVKGFGDNPILRSWGTFKADGASVDQLGAKNKQAQQLMKDNGWK